MDTPSAPEMMKPQVPRLCRCGRSMALAISRPVLTRPGGL